VDEVFPIGQGEVATNGAGRGLATVGRAVQRPNNINGLVTFYNHRHRRTRGNEQPQRRVERPLNVFGVELVGKLTGHLPQLHNHDRQPLGLKAADDGPGKTSAHGVGLDQHEGTLGRHRRRDVRHASTLGDIAVLGRSLHPGIQPLAQHERQHPHCRKHDANDEHQRRQETQCESG
jgi:hypothetical protein